MGQTQISMNTKEYKLNLKGGEYKATFSDLAEQANGSVLLEREGTVVLATAVIGKSGRGNPGYFNLTVEYMEKYYAAGKILGGQYTKREGRPSDQAILAGRVIDRTLRPLFPHHIKNPVQVIATVIALGKADPKIVAVNAASLALCVSDIPFGGPVGAVAMTRVKGDQDIKVDHYAPQNEEGVYDFDLTVCGRAGEVTMIEACVYEFSEDEVSGALEEAMQEIKNIEDWQKSIAKEIGKEKQVFEKREVTSALKEKFDKEIVPILDKGLFGKDSKSYIHEAEDKWSEILDADVEDDEERVEYKDYVNEIIDELVHRGAIEKNSRVDGRGFDEVRNIFAKAGGVSEYLHGTGIFYRGETHVLSVLTLDGPDEKHEVDGMEAQYKRRFMHHYNFPPYSVGETGRLGGLNRREMGHGFLAEKALVPVIPSKEVFPYTIRLVSEAVASNGSTSQASICGSSIALMDGGVPITAPVAGIAMGVMVDERDKTNYRILTDIQGPEDHHGDMDFKVAGTRRGVTAIQLDIKLTGVSVQILKEAMQKAKDARLHILDVIEKEIPGPRAQISAHAPEIKSTKIPEEKIGQVIGSGGKTIKEIMEVSGADLTIEDDGSVFATGKDGSAAKAIEMVQEIVKEWKKGDMAQGKVVKIIEAGAIVQISKYKDGFVHISEIAPFRVEKISDVLKEGMEVPVQVLDVDKERDRISLSIKSADPDFIKKPEAKA